MSPLTNNRIAEILTENKHLGWPSPWKYGGGPGVGWVDFYIDPDAGDACIIERETAIHAATYYEQKKPGTALRELARMIAEAYTIDQPLPVELQRRLHHEFVVLWGTP